MSHVAAASVNAPVLPVKQRLAPGTIFVHPNNSKLTFAIPVKRVKMPLSKSDASKLTPEGLSGMLNNIGLGCDQTKPGNLQPVIDNVKANLPMLGHAQSFIIDKIEKTPLGSRPKYLTKLRAPGLKAMGSSVSAEASSPWEPSDTAAGYATDLATIAAHFDDLVGNYPNFAGHRSTPLTAAGKYDTVDSIKSLFVQVAINASAAVITGVDNTSLEAVLSNIISPLNDTNVSNYDVTDNRLVFLVLDYDATNQTVAGLGFVQLDWHLTIQDYKKKKDNLKHDTNLTITARSIIYDSLDPIDQQITWIKNRSPKTFAFAMGIPVKYKFKIFDTLPSAGEEAFGCSLPLISKSDQLTAILFYSADVSSLGCLDNKASKAASTYSVSTTSGFTFSMTEKIGASVKAAAGVVFAKAEVTVSMELSFTEQWNSSQTETVSFNVPGGATAFLYKGMLQTRQIYYDPVKLAYSYGPEGVFYTNYITTSEVPLKGDPVYKAAS